MDSAQATLLDMETASTQSVVVSMPWNGLPLPLKSFSSLDPRSQPTSPLERPMSRDGVHQLLHILGADVISTRISRTTTLFSIPHSAVNGQVKSGGVVHARH